MSEYLFGGINETRQQGFKRRSEPGLLRLMQDKHQMNNVYLAVLIYSKSGRSGGHKLKINN